MRSAVSSFFRFLMLVAIFCVSLPQLHATPVSGTLSFVGDYTLTQTSTTFLCDLLAPFSCPAGSGQFQVTGPAAQSGSFVPLALTYGNIKSLNASAEPLNQSFLLPSFMTFMANPNIALDLTFIELGMYSAATCGAAPAVGQQCTPVFPALVTAANPSGKSMFNFTNTATGTNMSFTVDGIARNVATGETSPFTGVFTSQFVGTNYQNLLAQLAASGSITSSYGATIQVGEAPAVPEPSSLMLLGSGMAGMIGVVRRRFKH